jgi:PAT family beta-lactamase induction signal transducer AmpG
MTSPSLLKSRLFWVGILYFAQGFPFGVFYDVLPVYFRSQGVDLREIGLLSLLGLAWTVKFLWAPAVDYYRHHRRWMLVVDLAMGACLVGLSMQAGFGPPVWVAIGLFTLLSATNDVAIDGYTIELFEKHELGMVNGVRIGMARVGILAAGAVLILSDHLGWPGAFVSAAVLIGLMGVLCLYAPPERAMAVTTQRLFLLRLLLAALALVLVGYAIQFVLRQGLDVVVTLSATVSNGIAIVATVLLLAAGARLWLRRRTAGATAPALPVSAPLFSALAEMLRRPHILAVILFVLSFKLGDAAMGFMVKPYWVDSGFSATQIGLVSVNLGLVLSIAGGLAGGWFTDRVGIFRSLWILGLFQALSNLGYVWAASVIPPAPAGSAVLFEHQLLMYGASAIESFTGGLGTAAFLAFLMSIVSTRHSAAEYALLSSLFALTRHLAGFASGYGAYYLGYAPYFLLTFFLSFPAYLLLPWVKKMLNDAGRRE